MNPPQHTKLQTVPLSKLNLSIPYITRKSEFASSSLRLHKGELESDVYPSVTRSITSHIQIYEEF